MDYLIILISLLAFFCIIIFYLKNKNSFSEMSKPLIQNVKQNKTETFHLDTRYQYPLTPPVNPIAYKTELLNSIPTNNDLYTTQNYSTNDYDLNQPINNNTNQLNYSGGSTQLIKIPLQMNEPYNEQLRSQEVLITPYNRIKYGNC